MFKLYRSNHEYCISKPNGQSHYQLRDAESFRNYSSDLRLLDYSTLIEMELSENRSSASSTPVQYIFITWGCNPE